MQGIALIVVLAIVVEALVEYAKSVVEMFTKKQRKNAAIQGVALVASIMICYAANADLFAIIGVHFSYRWIGIFLTGIFASRGSNYISDLIGKIRKGNTEG